MNVTSSGSKTKLISPQILLRLIIVRVYKLNITVPVMISELCLWLLSTKLVLMLYCFVYNLLFFCIYALCKANYTIFKCRLILGSVVDDRPSSFCGNSVMDCQTTHVVYLAYLYYWKHSYFIVERELGKSIGHSIIEYRLKVYYRRAFVHL